MFVNDIGRLPLSLLDVGEEVVSSLLGGSVVVLAMLVLSEQALLRPVCLASEMIDDVLDCLPGLDSLDVVLEMVPTTLGSGRHRMRD